MNSIEELCGYYVALLRTAYNIHQNSHWKTRGSNFYGNHLLFERLYTNSAKDADGAAEKMIGVFGDATLDLQMQAKLIGKMMEKYSTSSPLENSIKVEKAILEFSDKLYSDLDKAGKLSLGVDNFIQGISDRREEAVYLLQQAMKEGSKTATRKKILSKFAANETDPEHTLHNKLLLWLTATVPSYVQGTYNAGDISVSIDMQHKKIFGNAKLSKVITPELQKKIEDGFKAYAIKLLDGDTQGFTIGMGFVMPPWKAP